MDGSCLGLRPGDQVPQGRTRYRTRRPLGGCEAQVQTRLCTCSPQARLECDAYTPDDYASLSCMSGCGGLLAHDAVEVAEERRRFARAEGGCADVQLQSRGARCVGRFGDAAAAPNATAPSGWCVLDPLTRMCTSAALFAAEACAELPPSPASPPAPLAPTARVEAVLADSSGEGGALVVVALSLAGAFLVLVGAALAYRRVVAPSEAKT